MICGDLAARARGLATRPAAGVPAADGRVLVAMAADAPAAIPARVAPAAIPAHVEAATRDRAAEDLAILERWAGDRAGALAAIVDDADVASLRDLVRGLVAGASADERLRGAVPTSRLPAPVLRELAAQANGGALAARLARHAHPAAPALAPLLGASPLDLLAVEHALVTWFAARARRGARRDRALAVYVAQVIDVANAQAALLLAARGGHLDRGAAFLDGGRRLTRATFMAAAAARSDASAARSDAATARSGAATAARRGDAAAGPDDRAAPRLDLAAAAVARAFAGTPLAEPLAGAGGPGAIEQAALAWHLATQRRLRREEPLGLAAVLGLVLARRDEQRRARRRAWGRALGGGA